MQLPVTYMVHNIHEFIHSVVVGGHDEGDFLLIDDAPHKGQEFASGVAVELAGRLIGDDQARAAGQGACDSDTLLLTTTHLVGAMVGPLFEADQGQRVHHAGAPLSGVADASDAQGQLDILEGRENRQESEALEDEADHIAPHEGQFSVAQFRKRLIEEGDLASSGLIETADHIQKCGFAATATPFQGDEATYGHTQVDPAQGMHLVSAASIGASGLGHSDSDLWCSLALF